MKNIKWKLVFKELIHSIRMMSSKATIVLDSGNMEAKDSSPSLSLNSISRNVQFETAEDLLSHLLPFASKFGNCAVLLDFDDTIAFKFHPDGTSEQSLLHELSLPSCDFEDVLRKIGECKRIIPPTMIDMLLQIQAYEDKYKFAIVTRRENGAEIIELFKASGLREPCILHQITFRGNEKGSSVVMGGVVYTAEPNRDTTIDKGAIVGEWISQNQSIQSVVFIDDVDINVNYVKEFLKEHENKLHECSFYGTYSDNSWRTV